jgi:hypothetical protein
MDSAPIEVHPSAMAAESEDARLLFCPFCRECYEGETSCPEHELVLVEFQDLPRQAHERETPGWDEAVVPWETRFGRAWLAFGALVAVIGFFSPVVAGGYDQQTISWTGLEMANGPARNLWTVPVVALLYIVFLYRRRTPNDMRSSRLAGLVLSLMPVLSLAYSLWSVARGADRTHGAVAISWSFGAYLIAASSFLLFWGSLRFGAMPEEYVPHGSEPDEEPRIEHEDRRRRRRKR